MMMKGSNERLRAQFKGHVTAPTFHLDAEELDYGKVGCCSSFSGLYLLLSLNVLSINLLL